MTISLTLLLVGGFSFAVIDALLQPPRRRPKVERPLTQFSKRSA